MISENNFSLLSQAKKGGCLYPNRHHRHDVDKQPISDIGILKSFFSQPTLVIIDELPHYLLGADSVTVGRVSLADLTIRFIMDLVSVIWATSNSCLILTLTAKQQLYEKYVDSIVSKVKTLRDFRADVVYILLVAKH